MTSVKKLVLKGDIDEVSEIQLQYILKILKDKGYEDEEVKLEAVGAKGDNYIAKVKRIIVGCNGNTFQMIAKFAPTTEAERQVWNTVALFKNEITFYNEIFPIFDKLQDEAKLSEDERLRHPECYGVLSNEPNEVVLLEDLSIPGFVILNRLKSLTNEEIKLVLKDIAKLHTVSFVLKNRQPELYKEAVAKFIDIWDYNDESEDDKAYFKSLENNILDILESEDHLSLVKDMFGKIKEITTENKANIDPKYCIILQGDCWTNNVMFKTEEGKAVQCIMIDYQTPKEWFLVYDIVSFIFSSTSREVRQEYYHEWISYYHDMLGKSLANFGCNVSEIYPREIMYNDLKKHGKFMFLVLMFYVIIIMKESDEIEDQNEGTWYDTSLSTKTMKKESIDRLKQRVEGIIECFKEYGYF